jgi:hypothetical protein
LLEGSKLTFACSAFEFSTKLRFTDFLKTRLLTEFCFNITEHLLVKKCRRGSRNFWWGDDMDEEKIGGGLGAAVGPQQGPGAEPLVGVEGASPLKKETLFSQILQ